jgi:excinuclease ABC subunit C
MERLKDQPKALPTTPGVYLFKDISGKVIYVGKATNLRSRVNSYFASADSLIDKVRRMMAKAADLDFMVTDSEQEAIFLECNLIKKYHPRYNVNLKDDKSFPYLKISLTEDYPQIYVTRRLEQDGSRYFGPYANAKSVRKAMDLIKKLFPYRSCRKKITGHDKRPCLEYHINRCVGPCIGEVSVEEYGEVVRQVTLFLEGKQDKIVNQLKLKMVQSSKNLEFERAAAVRDQLQGIEGVISRQKVMSARAIDEDAIAFSREGGEACAQVFFIRSGKLIGNEHFILGGTNDEDSGQIMASFIKQYYNSASYIPPQLLLQHDVDDLSAVSKWLEAKRGAKVKVLVPQRGAKKELVDLVAQNAAQLMVQRKIRKLSDTGKTAGALLELQQALGLLDVPKQIECYDISDIQGTNAVGSMVVFYEGKPKKSDYRRFNIKMVSGVDDYARMREVLRRRFARADRLSNKESSWAVMPDLLLIDGGKGHLGVALQVLKEAGIDSIATASIAKENEEIFLAERSDPIILPNNSPALFMLQRIRDEAHRFAITYHRKARQKSVAASILDDVPGIGSKRKKALIRHFGSVSKIREASLEELALVSGMNKTLADRLKESI